MRDVETFRAFEGKLESDEPRPEILLSAPQRHALDEFARKFAAYTVGVAAMGDGYVLVRAYDEHDQVAGEKLIAPG